MSLFQKANTDPQLTGKIRSQPEDFQVDEIPLFKPSGEGEHAWLHIKKTAENTDWVAGQLARIAGVARRDVSFAGLKDRHAQTTQWFSVWLPGRDSPDWQSALPGSVEVLEENRHLRKLKRGTLAGNCFRITIRDFSGDEAKLKSSVERITEKGVPNYFGEQRFGRGSAGQEYGFNVHKAEQWFKGKLKVKDRQKRSIYLSAARSWLFNHVLSERVANGCWDHAVPGDVFMLEGSRSCFCDTIEDPIIQRLRRQDIHPTGPLWGKGDLMTQGAIRVLEVSIVARFSGLSAGLERNGLKQERRALRLKVQHLDYTYKAPGVIELHFSLPAGAYATTVLREIGHFKEA